MPLLSIQTNAGDNAVPAGFIEKASALVAKLVGKPESYVTVFVKTDLMASFGGTQDPCAFVELQSIGGFANVNAIAGPLTKFITEELNIASNRFYIRFVDLDATKFSFKGSTFA
ncbi:macrophage migration inhibitory factor (MIF) domain-containing protein [Ditylenchus destructor]|nr:macrophage migration inhibitory factor (MIF) domain-containing protein [Ditylenchus destructor]